MADCSLEAVMIQGQKKCEDCLGNRRSYSEKGVRVLDVSLEHT
jgi:hypothetical protein